MPEVTELYTFLSTAPDGQEGVAAIHTGAGWLPLITSDLTKLAVLQPLAEQLAGEGQSIRMVRFVPAPDHARPGPPSS